VLIGKPVLMFDNLGELVDCSIGKQLVSGHENWS